MPGRRNLSTNRYSATSKLPSSSAAPIWSFRNNHQEPKGSLSGTGMRGKIRSHRKAKDLNWARQGLAANVVIRPISEMLNKAKLDSAQKLFGQMVDRYRCCTLTGIYC